MPKGLHYRLDLSEYTNDQFNAILEKIGAYDGFDEPVFGEAKVVKVLWLSDTPIEEALDIPTRCVSYL